MSEFEDGWIEFDEEDDYLAREKAEAEQRATTDPSFDYFEAFPPKQPKFEIGMYVAEQGFSVPLITDQAEWEKAFDDGTAMLRSEMPQDYDGLSGLLTSERLANADLAREDAQGYARELGSLVMRGLRSGELDAAYYMTHLRNPYMCWSVLQREVLSSAMHFGADLYLDPHNVYASRWRYVEGANVSVFADPNVEGRYHFGVKPAKQDANDYVSIGGYQVESNGYDTEQQFRKHKVPFVARPFIEFYEEIRNLPRFDTTQSPVLELQQDTEGNVHFLQYLKTGQKQVFTEPFDLPSSDDTLRTTNVRGVTPPNGKDMRLFMAPNILTRGMEGQAIFCSLIRPRGIEVQFAARSAAFILHEAYISFQDNHFDASPLFRPSSQQDYQIAMIAHQKS